MASSFAKNHLMNYIVDQPGFWSANDEDILEAIKKGFLECHMAMWKDLGEIQRLFRIQCEKGEKQSAISYFGQWRRLRGG